MRCYRLFFCLIFGWMILARAAFAYETIQAFDVTADLSYDRRLTVTETIDYDFGNAQRHGIYRFIPDVYDRAGGKYRLGITFLDATMDGEPVAWKIEGSGTSRQIRIGDKKRSVSGRHTYAITYRTDKAVNDFADHRELYWNVNGNGWGVTAERVTFALSGPSPANRVRCYSGSLGSTSEECAIRSTEKTVTANATRRLGPGEGLTIAVDYPLFAMRSRTMWERSRDFVADNMGSLAPLVAFAAMFYLWRRYGKEPRGRGIVVPQYEEPRGLPPAMMAALLEQKMSRRAVTATILDLARRGHLKVRCEGDGRFRRLRKFALVKGDALRDAAPYERALFDGLFHERDEVRPEDLKGKFWKSIEQARSNVFGRLREKKLFGANPSAVRGGWMALAVACAIGSVFLVPFFGEAIIISGLLSGLVIALFGWQMPQMTKEGAIVLEEIKGFKRFLSVTEKARLDFTDAPERKPEQFARFLPAAIAFGVEEKWADQFAGIDVRPAYFEGAATGWSAMQFARAADDFHDASSRSMYPPPSSAGSGGSGFSGGGSGGGFGGGGGGSW